MEKVSKKGRTYIKGRALQPDLRNLIIDDLLKGGGDSETSYFPGEFKRVADKFKVSDSTIKNIWVSFCLNKTTSKLPHGGGNPSNLNQDDLKLIETLVRANPSMSHEELLCELRKYGDIFGGTSKSTLSRAIHRRMLSSKEYTRKKITTLANERFTEVNMIYTQLFINYLNGKDPAKLLFFDEAGLKLPTACNRSHGYAEKGQRCIEIRRYHQDPSITINVLAGLDGVKYANIVNGPSATLDFLHFFGLAANAGDVQTGRPALELGDIVVLDNCPTHHYEGERNLESFLNDIGVELVYTPTYSPDFNPVEFVFSKMRTEMQYRLKNLVEFNLKVGAFEALESIDASDMKGFYRATGYIDI